MEIERLFPGDLARLEYWQEQWLTLFREDTVTDLASSYQWLANDFINLGQDKKRICYIAHQGGEFKGAMVCDLIWYKLGRWLPVPVVNTGSHFTNDFAVYTDVGAETLDALVTAVQRDYPYRAWINFERLTCNCYRLLEFWAKTSRVALLSRDNDDTAFFDVSCGDAEKFMQRLSTKTNANLRYYHRLLERKVGLLTHEINTSQSIDELKLNFSQFLAIEKSGWKGENGTAITQLEHSKRFHYTLCEMAATQGQMCWYKLYAGKQLVAMNLAIHRGSTLWVVKTAYDDDYKQYSPGALGLTELLKSVVEDKAINSVRMITNYSWLDRWCPDREIYHGARIFGKTAFGKISLMTFNALSKGWSGISLQDKD